MKKRASMVACVVGTCLVLGISPFADAKKKLRWFTGYNNASWRQVKEKFEKENPNVEVELITGDVDKFYTMITAGMMPDVWGPWETAGIRADVNRNWALELTPYIKRDGTSIKINDFFPGLMREFRVNGKQYSLPIFSYVDYFFYNKDIYAQAGVQPPPLDARDKSWNWDKMIQNAKKTTKTSASGNISVAGLDFARSLGTFPSFFHLWGAEPYSKETLRTSVPQKVDWDSSEMVTCLTRMWELIYKHRVARPDGGGFDTGKTASSMDYGWWISTYMNTKKVKWEIAPLPWAVTNSGTLWPDGWRIAKTCKDKELAWKFVKFTCSPETMRLIVSGPNSAFSGTPLARKSVFDETLGKNIAKATGMTPSEVLKVHEQADDVGVVKYGETVCLHVDLSRFLQPTMNDLWANKVSPNQAAAALQKQTNVQLPNLFKRWLRNIKFTGAEKN